MEYKTHINRSPHENFQSKTNQKRKHLRSSGRIGLMEHLQSIQVIIANVRTHRILMAQNNKNTVENNYDVLRRNEARLWKRGILPPPGANFPGHRTSAVQFEIISTTKNVGFNEQIGMLNVNEYCRIRRIS
uniref:Uncharacterized protein n=1 Tax=Romanomermis culicivorax TaxID=13658 RepID=A0A915J793_ROMCU